MNSVRRFQLTDSGLAGFPIPLTGSTWAVRTAFRSVRTGLERPMDLGCAAPMTCFPSLVRRIPEAEGTGLKEEKPAGHWTRWENNRSFCCRSCVGSSISYRQRLQKLGVCSMGIRGRGHAFSPWGFLSGQPEGSHLRLRFHIK